MVNIPSFLVRTDSEKHIDFALTSPFGSGRPGRVKRKGKTGGGGGDDGVVERITEAVSVSDWVGIRFSLNQTAQALTRVHFPLQLVSTGCGAYRGPWSQRTKFLTLSSSCVSCPLHVSILNWFFQESGEEHRRRESLFKSRWKAYPFS